MLKYWRASGLIGGLVAAVLFGLPSATAIADEPATAAACSGNKEPISRLSDDLNRGAEACDTLRREAPELQLRRELRLVYTQQSLTIGLYVANRRGRQGFVESVPDELRMEVAGLLRSRAVAATPIDPMALVAEPLDICVPKLVPVTAITDQDDGIAVLYIDTDLNKAIGSIPASCRCDDEGLGVMSSVRGWFGSSPPCFTSDKSFVIGFLDEEDRIFVAFLEKAEMSEVLALLPDYDFSDLLAD